MPLGLKSQVWAFGRRHSVIEWAQDPLCKVSVIALHRRLLRGWPAETAIATPPKRNKRNAPASAVKYRGVSFHPQNKRWIAKIKHEDRTITIGYFDSQVAAARAFDRKARELRGDQAVCNFPLPER